MPLNFLSHAVQVAYADSDEIVQRELQLSPMIESHRSPNECSGHYLYCNFARYGLSLYALLSTCSACLLSAEGFPAAKRLSCFG